LDSQTALELSTLTRNWISARLDRTELDLKLAASGTAPVQRIEISGGLPELPGTRISMPHVNGVSGQGSELNGTVIDADAQTYPAFQRASAPFILYAGRLAPNVPPRPWPV
jgi:hypothetical protein